MILAIRIRGSVQIMSSGVFAIGLVNTLAYLLPPEQIIKLSPHGVGMAFMTAVALTMTGTCLWLMVYKPEIKTEYHEP